MITAIKNRIGSATMSISDVNMSLRSVTKYCWMAAGAFFVLYLYLVGALTFSVIKQESLATSIKSIVSETSQQEVRYLDLQKGLTVGYALENGFVTADAITYASLSRNFAWNFEQ